MELYKSAPGFDSGNRLIGWFVDEDYEERIQIEHRSAYHRRSEYYSAKSRHALYTTIRNVDYRATESRFFEALAGLLDQFPPSSAVRIVHPIVVLRRGQERAAELEEWLRPHKVRDGSAVVYQLSLLLDETRFETRQHLDFADAAEDLRHQLEPDYVLKVCQFCHFLMPFSDRGGTDYRHDQLYCLRDVPELLDEVIGSDSRFKEQLPLLEQDLTVDALHSCPAFTYRPTPRY